MIDELAAYVCTHVNTSEKAIKDKKSESVLTLKGDDGHTIESQGHLIFEADESNKSSIIVVLWV